MSHLSPARLANLLALYKDGTTYKNIAELVDCDEAAVAYHARKAGLPKRGRTGRPVKYTGLETEYECYWCQLVLPVASFSKAWKGSRCKRPVSSICRPCSVERRTCGAYNITSAQFKAVQASCCAICQRTREEVNASRVRPASLFIDHDHSTGKIRGVLCESCNSGLGSTKDSAIRLSALLHYLAKEHVYPFTPNTKAKLTTQREYHVHKTYGIPPDLYNLLNTGVCHCCGDVIPTGKHTCIDHCHATHMIRGLVCWDCNIALGKFKDSVELITRAIHYLEAPPGLPVARAV